MRMRPRLRAAIRRGRWTVLVCLALLLAAAPPNVEGQRADPGRVLAQTPSGPSISGFVRVIDAQSLDVTVDGARTAVRLVGVDTPQGNTSCGRLASALLQNLVRAGIRLEEDPTV